MRRLVLMSVGKLISIKSRLLFRRFRSGNEDCRWRAREMKPIDFLRKPEKSAGGCGGTDSQENIVARTLKSCRQGRIVGANRQGAVVYCPSPSSWRSLEPARRRSANGSEAGTAEYSGFFPQHGTKGTA